MVKISNHFSEFMLYPFNQFLVFFCNADSTQRWTCGLTMDLYKRSITSLSFYAIVLLVMPNILLALL